MLPICQVCLRTDKKLQTVEEDLENWHDELTDFAIETAAVQFCAECAHLLRKFYNYKKKCRLAAKVLSTWLSQKERDRKPLHLLSKQMPPCSIGLAYTENSKIFIYEAEESNTTNDLDETLDLNISDLNTTSYKTPSTNATHANYPHFITVDTTSNFQNQIIINGNQYTGDKPNEYQQVVNENQSYVNENQRDGKKNQTYVNDNQPSIDGNLSESQSFVYTHIVNEEVKLEIEEDENSGTLLFKELKNNVNEESKDSDSGSQFDITQLIQDADLKDSDSSDDEVLIMKKGRNTEDDSDLSWLSDLETKKPKTKKAKTKRVRHKKPINIEMLKKVLLNRFAKCREVKDDEGNVIEKECIINSLDKMHMYTLNQIRKRVKDSPTLTPEAIQVLSRVQKKYGDQYSSVFTVEHLVTLEDAIAEFNQRQDYETYSQAEYKCTLCFRGFKHKKMLDYHVRMFHDMALPHPCTICHMRFKKRHALLKHRVGHKAVYKCKLCPLITNYRTAMINHYHQHKGVVYKCTLCVNTFKSKSCLSAHMNCMHHSQYICSLCARTFASDIGLAQHKLRKHSDETEPPAENTEITEKGRTCEPCKITFASEIIYMKHLEWSHQKEMPYVYKKRIRSAPKQKPRFICRVCNIVEHSYGRLIFHFNREHPTENYELMYSNIHKHLCHVCGKGYSSITDLNEHRHIHTGAKPYVCDKCPKSFHRKYNLRQHQERHLPPTRECPTCHKKFVSAANLNNHIKMHIGVRHYTCDLCSKSFLHRSALNAHVRGVHQHVRRQRKQAKPVE